MSASAPGMIEYAVNPDVASDALNALFAAAARARQLVRFHGTSRFCGRCGGRTEDKADERWGGQDDYETYKRNTPVLVMKPPSRDRF